MYYNLEYMLVSSILHVDGACIWRPHFDIAVYIIGCKIIAFVNFQEIKVIDFIYRGVSCESLEVWPCESCKTL